MALHKPPANDAERLENLTEGLSRLSDGPSADEIRAEAERAGIDFAAWGAEIRAKAGASGPREEQRHEKKTARAPRRGQRIAVTLASAAALAILLAGIGAGVMVAVGPSESGEKDGRRAGAPRMTGEPDASADAGPPERKPRR